MDANNPYQSPTADLDQTPQFGETDQTSVFSPKGRFGRLSYLAWTTVFGGVIWLLMGLLAGIGVVDVETLSDNTAMFTNPLLLAINIVSIVIGFLFSIRRLHDFNRSGWWSVLGLVPLVNLLLALALIFWPGTPGPNRFGPPRETRTWEKIVGWLFPIILILAIAAAIGIPAYQAYVQEAAQPLGG